jgi:hypothetical protein
MPGGCSSLISVIIGVLDYKTFYWQWAVQPLEWVGEGVVPLYDAVFTYATRIDVKNGQQPHPVCHRHFRQYQSTESGVEEGIVFDLACTLKPAVSGGEVQTVMSSSCS